MNRRDLFFEGETLHLMSITVIMKPLALVSQMLIAAYFGAGAYYDAYSLSFFLVTFVAMTMGRVFSSVALPQLLRVRGTSLEGGNVYSYQNALISFFYLPTLLVLVGLAINGNLAVDVIGRGLPAETKIIANKMVKVMALPAIFMALTNILRPILNMNNYFRMPAMLPLVNVISMIVCLIAFHGKIGIWALPLGFGISYVVQALLVFWKSLKTGSIEISRPWLPEGGLDTIWQLTWMVFLAESMTMINSFVDRWFAAGLEAGSISSISYAMTIVNFGVQVFFMSLIVVMFTKMSELIAEGQIAICDEYVRDNLVKVVNLVVPVSLILALSSPEIVEILFRRGAYNDTAALKTSGTMTMYLVGLPAIVINGMIARLFHSLQKIRDKIWLGIQFLVTNILGNFLLVKSFGTVGLAASSSFAINIHLFLSLFILGYYRTGLQPRAYFWVIFRAYIMAGIAFLAYHFSGIEIWLGDTIHFHSTKATAFGVASLKTVFLVVIFGLVFFLFHRWKRWRCSD